MQLRDFFGFLRKRWWVIVVIMIPVIAGALLLSLVQNPTYEAKATCMVSANTGTTDQFSAIQIIEQLLHTINKMTTSQPVLEATSGRMDFTKTPEQLKKTISSQVLTDTQLIVISAKDRSAETSMVEANAAAESLIEFVNQQAGTNGTYKVVEVEMALIPTSPVSPKPWLNGVLGLVIGLVLGFTGAAIVENLDVSIKTKEELSSLQTKPVLGELPLFKNGTLRNGSGSSRQDDGKDTGILEQTRTVRTNIQYLNLKNNLRVFLVTSPSLGEGKSFVSMQLARAFAAQGKRTVLVDADLRKPETHSGQAQRGLTDLIMGTVDLPEVLRATDMQLLRFLPSGPLPPNPSELLDSASMQDILGRLRKECDAVIIDTCPIDIFSDPLVLASKADGVILVVAARETSIDSIKTATDALSGPNINLLGTVLNKAKKAPHQDYYYYYSHRSNLFKRPHRTKL